MTLLATTPSPFAPELNGRPEDPGEVPAAAGLDVAGLAGRIVPFPVAAGRYDKLRAVRNGVAWLDIPLAGELGETVIGAAEEQPRSRLVRYDLAERRRSVEVEGVDDYAVSADGPGWLTGPGSRWRSSRPARTRLPASISTGSG